MSTETKETIASRIIPGLQGLLGQKAKPKRARSKKPATTAGSTTEPTPQAQPSAEVETNDAAATVASEPLALSSNVPLVPQPTTDEPLKRNLASITVAKRIKAVQKKIQRIQGYQDQTASLNPDQQKAVASKPALEAIVKELLEVQKVLESEESDFEKALAVKKTQEEKRVQSRIALAVHEAKKQHQSDLTLLLQFFHLNALFTPGSGFAPPTLPAVVESATGQEAAAVKTLAEALVNGPLMGGQEDAFERIERLTRGDAVDIVESVDYARIKQMIFDLTAPPAELSDAHAVGTDSVTLGHPAVNGFAHANQEETPSTLLNAPPTGPSLTFMQASELEEGRESTLAPAAPEASAQATGEPITSSWAREVNVEANDSYWPPTQEVIQNKRISSWADEVDEAQAPEATSASAKTLPDPVPGPAPVAAVAETAAAPVADAPAAVTPTPAAGQGAQRGRARGPRGPRAEGGGRGRGSYRKDATPRDVAPAEEGWSSVPGRHANATRPSGGRGGRGRGRGRAGASSTAAATTAATVTATAA